MLSSSREGNREWPVGTRESFVSKEPRQLSNKALPMDTEIVISRHKSIHSFLVAT